MVIELSSGPLLAVEIASKCAEEHPYQQFRELCGPMDPVRNRFSSQFSPKPIGLMINVVFYLLFFHSQEYRSSDPSKYVAGYIWCKYRSEWHTLQRH